MISFVGAGPGAADLITLRGADRLAAADIVVWASSLVPETVLDHCQPNAVRYDSATMTLEDVIAVFEGNPNAAIVRLHSGDPSIYGAIQEQIQWCVTQDRQFEVVPGVSSISAAAAELGQELTVPMLGQAIIVTRIGGRTSASMPTGQDVEALASAGATMAILLSGARPDEVQNALLAENSGYKFDTPAAVVVRATWPDQQVVRTTVGQLADTIRATGVTMTLTVIVGAVLGAVDDVARSHLYHPQFSTSYRLRSAAGDTAGRPSKRRDR